MEASQSRESRRAFIFDGGRSDFAVLIDRAIGDALECHFASDLLQARTLLESGRFQVALCNVGTATEGELAVIELLAEWTGGTAIIACGDSDDQGRAKRALDLGAHAYQVRPVSPAQIAILTEGALRNRGVMRRIAKHSAMVDERIATLIDQAPIPLYVKDTELRYVIANPMAHEVLGRPAGDLIGRSDHELFPPELANPTAESDRRIIADGERFEDEVTINLLGQVRTFRRAKFPYLDEDGKVVGVFGIATDISDHKQAETLRAAFAIEQGNLIAELRRSRQETVDRLTRALVRRDTVSGDHVSRMAIVTAFLAEKLGLSSDQVVLLRAAAPMHDVGKIAISDQILGKEGELTFEERAEMERHVAIGHEILAGSQSELLELAATIALAHHENFDGSGYPRGLRGNEIPIEGRIAAVADVFDALLSERPYRPALPVEEVVERFEAGRGTYFDPDVVDVLLANFEAAIAARGKAVDSEGRVADLP